MFSFLLIEMTEEVQTQFFALFALNIVSDSILSKTRWCPRSCLTIWVFFRCRNISRDLSIHCEKWPLPSVRSRCSIVYLLNSHKWTAVVAFEKYLQNRIYRSSKTMFTTFLWSWVKVLYFGLGPLWWTLYFAQSLRTIQCELVVPLRLH